MKRNLLSFNLIICFLLGIFSSPDLYGANNSSKYKRNGSTVQEVSFSTNMPLTIVPSLKVTDMPLIFFLSGDGGWSEFDHNVSKNLSEQGIPVIGLDTRKYFWKEKQPAETSAEIARVVNYYCGLWNKNSFVLLGYSFGACIAPFIVSNFPVSTQNIMKKVYCLSPDLTGDFKIHIADLLSLNTVEKYDVLDEMKKIKQFNPVCIFGEAEDEQEKDYFVQAGIKVLLLPGEHHYNNDFKAVANKIINDISSN